MRISLKHGQKSAHKNHEGHRLVVNQMWVPVHTAVVPPGGGLFQTALGSQERRRRREKGGHYPREYRATSSGVWRVEWETWVAEKHEQKTKTRCRTNPAKSTHPLREFFLDETSELSDFFGRSFWWVLVDSTGEQDPQSLPLSRGGRDGRVGGEMFAFIVGDRRAPSPVVPCFPWLSAPIG